MKYGKIIVLSATLAGLAACTTSPNNTPTYGPVHPPQISNAPEKNRMPAQTARSEIYSEQMPHEASEQNIATTETSAGNTAISTTTETVQPSATAQVQQPARVANSGSGISTNLAYTQAWTRVGKALPASGYPVMEQDTSSGTYYVLDKSSTGGVIKRNTPIYQVRVQRSGQGTNINVLNAQNQPADPAISTRILNSIKNELS